MTIQNEWLESHTQKTRLDWKRAALGVVIALVLVATGLIVGRTLGTGAITASVGRGEATPQALVRGRSDELHNGGPLGYKKTKEGAATAAENFVTIGSSSLIAEGRRYSEALKTMAAPEWRSTAKQTGRNAVAFFQDRYGAGGSLFTAPIATEVVDLTPGSAKVNVWSVSVASGPHVPEGEQVWSLTKLRLRWVQGDWHIAGQQTNSVPAPILIEGQRLGSIGRLAAKFDNDA